MKENSKQPENRALTVVCRIIRILTAPALLAILLCVLLAFEYPQTPLYRFVLLGLFVGVIPLVSYPVCFLIPALKKRGRDFERKAAFVSSAVGYIGGAIWAIAAHADRVVLFIALTYLFSLVLLVFFNKGLKIKASGHACGIFGPLLAAVLLAGPEWIAPCAIILALVFWSSLRLRRHTVGQLIFGMLSSGAAMLAAILVLGGRYY